jgi:hypothetical protein
MEDAITNYLDYVHQESIDADSVFIDQLVKADKFFPGCYGTVDCLIIYDNEIKIIDLKYGKGVKVYSEDNYQLLLYALSAYSSLSLMYKIQSIKMVIVQPRLNHIDEWVISNQNLILFGEVVKKVYQKFLKNELDYVPSEKTCQWCSIKGSCSARADHSLQIAVKEFKPCNELTVNEIGLILQSLDGISRWVNDLKDYSLKLAISGIKIPGWKLVEGRANRKWVDGAEEVLKDKDILFERRLCGITKAQKILGKELDKYTVKPIGTPSLVPESDKRKEIGIGDDFNERIE